MRVLPLMLVLCRKRAGQKDRPVRLCRRPGGQKAIGDRGSGTNRFFISWPFLNTKQENIPNYSRNYVT